MTVPPIRGERLGRRVRPVRRAGRRAFLAEPATWRELGHGYCHHVAGYDRYESLPGWALDIMIEIDNRFALDGRDPDSYAGIFRVLGRFDRGWPARPVSGKVRSMSSAATRRKLRLHEYLERWSGPEAP